MVIDSASESAPMSEFGLNFEALFVMALLVIFLFLRVGAMERDSGSESGSRSEYKLEA